MKTYDLKLPNDVYRVFDADIPHVGDSIAFKGNRYTVTRVIRYPVMEINGIIPHVEDLISADVYVA